jgi:23S rRNA (uracil747-C5)-methyltransferase
VPYSEQLIKKEMHLNDLLSFTKHPALLKTVSSKTKAFRNKAKLTVTGSALQAVIGLTGEAELDQGREILNCPIHHPKLNEVIQAMPEFIREFNLIPYQIKERTGELKGLILFYSEVSNELYLRFVLRSKECISRIQKLLPKLQQRFPEITCASVNLQPIPHAILEGKEEIFISKNAFIRHDLNGLMLKLAPQAFVQTNTEVALQLYQTAAEWIKTITPEHMLELFCGQGAFSFYAAHSAKKITGVEINPDAVKIASETARELGLNHLHFISADARNHHLNLDPDLILVNPPRKGLTKIGVDLILKHEPKDLIYSSCSAESLSDDLKTLTQSYQIRRVQIFDLFPHTPHFETLVHLQRN